MFVTASSFSSKVRRSSTLQRPGNIVYEWVAGGIILTKIWKLCNSNILNRMKRKETNWIGHILCRKCLLKHVMEGKVEGRIEVKGR